MTHIDYLKNFDLVPGTPVADVFIKRGVTTFRDAALCIRQIPYGRNSDRGNRLLVLSENRGTCSGKHALLADLAQEHREPVELHSGFFLISGATHPAVASVLKKAGLCSYPELHAYLVFEGKRFDFTGPENPIDPPFEIFDEMPVQPAQVESFKEQAHKKYLEKWLVTEGLAERFTLDQLWKIREQCIAARSES